MGQCFGVFNTWDEEYDKFTSQLREMSKKKREETLKFSWRANSAHKRLQERISKMRECVFSTVDMFNVSLACILYIFTTVVYTTCMDDAGSSASCPYIYFDFQLYT